MKPRIIFFGSSKYSVIIEKSLQEHFGLTLVVTIPDKRIGRKQEIIASPVKAFAIQHKLPIIAAESLTQEIINQIETYRPDFGIVADYRIILPKQLLTIPRFDFLNVHHSLLPKYRGPSPAPSAILANEKTTGVSIIVMNAKVDSGDILNQKQYDISPTDTTDTLLTILNSYGAELLIPIIKNYDFYKKNRKEQNELEATKTKLIKKADGYIDSNNPPPVTEIDRMIRAYYPWPGVWTKIFINEKERILKLLPFTTVQLEGKKPTSLKDFLNGYPNLESIIKPLFLRK